MDLLNLDELTGVERQITIRGVNYPVVERSIGVLLDSIKMSKAAAKRKGAHADEEAFLNDMIRTLRTILPECPEEVVRGLTMPQMVTVLEFCNQDPNKMADEALKEAEARKEEGDVADSKDVEPGKA